MHCYRVDIHAQAQFYKTSYMPTILYLNFSKPKYSGYHITPTIATHTYENLTPWIFHLSTTQPRWRWDGPKELGYVVAGTAAYRVPRPS
jgi:hypothetical protein